MNAPLARRVACALACIGASVIATAASAALALRTFVASTGNDANPCTLVQPCRSFTAALAQTLDGGEIVILDTAGYGRVTIMKSVSIIAPPGIYGGITVPSGMNGVDIDTPGVIVSLRGLTINGIAGAAAVQYGIRMQAGAELHLRDVEIVGLTGSGMHLTAPSATVYANNIVVRNNTLYGITASAPFTIVVDGARVESNVYSGIAVTAGARLSLRNATIARHDYYGVELQAATGETTVAAIDNSRIDVNGCAGVYANAAGGGVGTVNVVDSVASGNGNGIFCGSLPRGGVVAHAPFPSSATADVMNTAASYNNGAGILATGDGARAVASDCMLTENATYGLQGISFAQMFTRGNNTILGNGSGDISGTTPLGGM
jgi:hypothetical protein